MKWMALSPHLLPLPFYSLSFSHLLILALRFLIFFKNLGKQPNKVHNSAQDSKAAEDKKSSSKKQKKKKWHVNEVDETHVKKFPMPQVDPNRKCK